jgi:hypothetical protein
MGGANSYAVLDDAFNFLRLRNIDSRYCTVERLPSSREACPEVLGDGDSIDHEFKARSASRPKLLVWSIADEAGIARLTVIYSKHFTKTDLSGEGLATYIDDLAFTLIIRRSTLPWKSFMLADST